MSQRMIVLVVSLACICIAPGVVRAQASTSVNGSVVVPARPNFNATLVVVTYQGDKEVGRADNLPFSNTLTASFRFTANATGALTIKAYIVDSDRIIRLASQQVAYTPGITLQLAQASGGQRLPFTSTGFVLLVLALLSALLACGVGLYRRQRLRVRSWRSA